MGAKKGSFKAASVRLGITQEEYLAHVEAGEKWCHKCKQWKMTGEFGIDKSRWDELSAKCQSCAYQSSRPGPTRRERLLKAAIGLGYCRKCENWHPKDKMSNGLCRLHANEEDRQRYATNPRYRMERKQHARSRKRGIDPIPPDAQEMILNEFGGLCAYCATNPATTWDHVVPVSKNGRTVPWNIVPACVSCNSSKNNKNVESWRGVCPSSLQAFYDRIDLQWCSAH